MTDPERTPRPQPSNALQSVRPGVTLVGLLWLVMAFTGLLPEGQLWMAGLGLLAASATATGAAWIHLRMFHQTAPSDQPLLGSALVTRALAMGFLAKLVALTVAILVLVLLQVKFDKLAAFALAFTAGSLIVQLWSAMVVNRSTTRTSVQTLPRS